MGIILLALVLLPLQVASAQGGTLAALISGDGRLSSFDAAVGAADLGGMYNGPGPYTIFAPTDAAFAVLNDDSLTNANAVRQTLLYHTLQGGFTKADLYQQESVKTALGKSIRIQNLGNLLLNDSATLVVHDIQASNGVLHLIDIVLDHNKVGYGDPSEAPPADAGDSAETNPGEPAPEPEAPKAMPESNLVLIDPSQNPAFRGTGHIKYWSGIHSDSSSCKGTTWVVMKQMDGVTFVGSDRQTNPYRGDTTCAAALPVLCLTRDFSTPPASSRGENYHDGWAGGRVKATVPVSGSALNSLAAANQLCADAFGANYRMVEFHDGNYGAGIGEVSGWDIWAYGGLHNNQRYWVYNSDQPSNPWDSVQHKTAPPHNTWVDQVLYPGGDPAYKVGPWMGIQQGRSAGRGTCKGMTWAVNIQRDGMVLVGSDAITNPFTGDTSCDARLRILCIRVEGYTPPANSNGHDFTQYWSGGTVASTFPVTGHTLSTRAAANQQCVDANGPGWRMAEFHDGSLGTGGGLNGWQLWAYGGLHTGGRFWVSINDQPANPWNP